ncbi:MAG: globin [bacterium]|nr:globin [bacterium]
MSASAPSPAEVFELFGGEETFLRLVSGFYSRVREDEVLAPMYPPEDWEGSEWRLAHFLIQYWGGPTTYSEQRGHPMLRRRHLPFRVDADARERWLIHMRASLDELALDPALEGALWDYLRRAAFAMQNVEDPA